MNATKTYLEATRKTIVSIIAMATTVKPGSREEAVWRWLREEFPGWSEATMASWAKKILAITGK